MLSSCLCTQDPSKILDKLVIGEKFIEKMQRAQSLGSVASGEVFGKSVEEMVIYDIILKCLLESRDRS